MRLYGASAGEAEASLKWYYVLCIMYYCYILHFRKNGKLYCGFTSNLKKRIINHRAGNSEFTSRNGDFDLIFYEAYKNEKDAREAERYFKTGHGREVLRGKLNNYFGGFA